MAVTSIEKALEICETLSRAPRGMSVAELSRALHQPPPSIHRLLSVLKRRGYVRQDEDTQRYGLTLKMLDLSFRFLGRSEIRLHGVPRPPRLRAAVGASRVPGDPRRRRSDLRVGDGPRRSGDADRLRARDAGALCRLLLDDAGDAPAELPAARVGGGSAAGRIDDCAAGAAGRGRRGAAASAARARR